MIHPLIAQFEMQAQVLDAQPSNESLDDAVARLAAWMNLAQDRFSEDDMTVLVKLGGILYREGLRRRHP